jgi:O-antigen/teichoic acid export membrane protein
MASRLLRSGVIYGAANAISAGVPFLLLPVLTRALPPDDYGAVIAFFLLATLSASLAGLNAHTLVAVRWFDRRDDGSFARLVGSALAVALASTAACAALLAGYAALGRETLGLAAWMWPLAALAAGCNVVLGMRTTLWQSQGNAIGSAVLQVGSALLNMAFSLLGVLALALGASGRIGGAMLATLLAALAAVWLLRRGGELRWAWSRDDVRRLCRFGLPLVPHALAGAVLASADRFAVSSVLGNGALGVYGAAAQIGMVINVIGDAAVKTLSPWMYAQLSQPGKRGRLRVVAMAYGSIPLWLLLALAMWALARWAAPLLLGPAYLEAATLSLWFLLGGAMSAIYLSVAGLFFFTSKTEWLSAATVGSAVVAVILAPMLVKRFGVVGGAISYLCVQASQLLLSWLLSTRVQPMPWHRPALAWRALRGPQGAR